MSSLSLGYEDINDHDELRKDPVFGILAVRSFFFSSRRRHTRFDCDWSSDVCSSDLSWWDAVTQHSGLALSYLNYYDTEAAWQLAHDLGEQPACAIIKHANACGVAVAEIGRASCRERV